MKVKLKYIWFIAALTIFAACEDDDTNMTVEELPALSAGNANFTNYVSLGNSLTAGFTDGALFIASQQNSFPNMLSQQFGLVGGGSFTQPLMNDNFGGLLLGGTRIVGPRLVTTGGPPQPIESVVGPVPVSTDLAVNNPTGPFNNMGVPGAKSFHLIAPGYGNVSGLLTDPMTANPYFVRMTGATPDATVLELAAAQSPSFFSLWIGNNDVLGYALSGGDGSNPITDQGTFNFAYNTLISTLTGGGAQGVVANIPNVTAIPFFNTIPNNALEIDATTAAQLTGFFQAVVGIFTQALVLDGIPLDQAQALASQYAITFEEGANRFVIDVPVTAQNPLGFRQMTEEELLLLTIDQGALAQGYGSVALSPDVLQVLGILQAGGTPTPEQGALVLAAVNGIDDKDALDTDELDALADATTAFNGVISSAANSAGLAFVDANALLDQLAAGGISTGSFILTSDLVTGGAFSLDGVHPNARGYALIANEFMKAIDATYGSNFEDSGNLLNVGDFPTNYSPLLQ